MFLCAVNKTPRFMRGILLREKNFQYAGGAMNSKAGFFMCSRSEFFCRHLFISLMVSLLVLLWVLGIWYPSPLHVAVGVARVVVLLLVVNLMLGPLLTLFIYDPNKRSLIFDLVVVAMLQIGALGYGLWVVAEGRPAWLVFNIDRFDLVRVLDIDNRQLNDAADNYRQPSWLGPRWVAAVPPVDVEERNDLVFEAVFSGVDLAHRPIYYKELEVQSLAMQQRMQPVADLRRFNDAKQVEALLEEWPEADAFLPLMASAKPMTVLMQRRSNKVIAVVELDPWAN